MECCEKKVSWTKIVLWVWAVGATLFIAWQLLQNGAYRMGVTAGQADALSVLTQRAADPASCQRGIVLDQAGKVVLIPVTCLQQPAADTSAPKKK